MPERAREITELLAVGLGSAGLTGFFGWLQRRTSNKAENQAGEAAILGAATRLQEVMNTAAEKAAERWADELAAARSELAAARSEAFRLRERVDSLEGQLTSLKNENRQIRQHAESLEATLRRNGVDLSSAMAPGALLVVEKGIATVTPAPRKRRKAV